MSFQEEGYAVVIFFSNSSRWKDWIKLSEWSTPLIVLITSGRKSHLYLFVFRFKWRESRTLFLQIILAHTLAQKFYHQSVCFIIPMISITTVMLHCRDTTILRKHNQTLSFIGIILRWGFLIWELIFFIYCGLFVLILVVFVLFLLSLRFQLKTITKFETGPTLEDQIRRTNNWIYNTKKSILDSPSGSVAHRIEALSPLSEDSGFKSNPSGPKVYMVKKTTTMEGSNYKTQYSYPRSRLEVKN